ncbi:MAG: multicopper oxidase family protein [Myxococcota bacterium]
MKYLVLLPLVLACTPETVEDSPQEPSLPMVEGVAAAEDHDDDPKVVEVHLTASRTEKDWIDGGATPVWAYNGQVPGPLIHARVGDTLRVVFTNDLPDPTTIHWHGLRIDNAMDGVPAVQEPIEPGETFTYEFVLPDAGSYWYHPHIRGHEQVDRGLYGPLVVHEAQESEPTVDRDRYFVLDDVALQENGRHYGFSTGGMDGMHGRHGNVLLANGQTELITDTVQPGTVERWRIVNTANARLMYADVRGADWRVVGVDGGLLEEPYTTDRLRLPVGRRFDVEVIPRADAEKLKLRVLIPSQTGFDRFPMFEAAIEGPPASTAVPIWPAAAMPDPVPETQEVDVELDFGSGGMMGMAWVINGQRYEEGDSIPIQGNVPTRIHLRDVSGAGHPFHLHGQFFEVLSRNGVEGDIPGPLDTIHVGGDDELELFTMFDNPGLWLGHCHILEHAELGMMTSFDVTP